MILAYSYIPVVEEILVKRLSKYFIDPVKWDNLYPNHPIRINNEYPWVPYMTDESLFIENGIDLNKVNETLFPSITVVTSQDNKSPSVFLDIKKTKLLKEDLADFQAQAASEGYSIAPEALTAIETHFDTNDALYGVNIVEQRRDTINIDITTDDSSTIKDRIYSYVELYLVGHGKIELKDDLDIEIISTSVSGGRSGIYNIDFGRTLRGSTIQFEVDYKITQCLYDTEAGIITDVQIDHTVGG
jgi:hypothetical protein